MTYSKVNWTTSTPINTTNLGKMDQGIADAIQKDGSVAMTNDLIIKGNTAWHGGNLIGIQAGHSHSVDAILDVDRTTNKQPSAYPMGKSREFKSCASLVVPTGSWCAIETFRLYLDFSGGGVYQYAYVDDGKTYQRYGDANGWKAWKRVGGVDYKTYTTATANTSLAASTYFDINLVNITGKGFVDVLVADVLAINLSLADGVEIIVDGQVLWSLSSSSGSTSGNLIHQTYPLVGEHASGYGHYDSRFDRIYFSSSFRVRAYGTASSTGGSYAVYRCSYHLEQ